MSASTTSNAPKKRGTLGVPVYVPGDKPGEFWAHFASGLTVKTWRGRARAYPGLRSEAPPTQAFYAAMTKLGKGNHVLDVGSGSGQGTQLLSETFERVTAIEIDPHALAFARAFAPLAQFVQADACVETAPEAVDFAIIADVLGQVAAPEALLARTRRALQPSGTLMVAEPSAYVAQRLMYPARRAFSARSLRALLVRSGFEAKSELCASGTFTGCLAHPLNDAAADALVSGLEAAAAGDEQSALVAFARARLSERRELRLEAELAEAHLCVRLGHGDRAALALFRARELDADDPRPLAGLSRLALLTGAASEALRLAVDAAQLDRTDTAAAAAVAAAADMVGHPDTFDTWRIAHALQPDSAYLATELARVASERSDYAFGISVLEQLRKYSPNIDPALHVTLAWLLLAEGRTRDAALEARVVTALMPNDPSVKELWAAIDQASAGAAVGRG